MAEDLISLDAIKKIMQNSREEDKNDESSSTVDENNIETSSTIDKITSSFKDFIDNLDVFNKKISISNQNISELINSFDNNIDENRLAKSISKVNENVDNAYNQFDDNIKNQMKKKIPAESSLGRAVDSFFSRVKHNLQSPFKVAADIISMPRRIASGFKDTVDSVKDSFSSLKRVFSGDFSGIFESDTKKEENLKIGIGRKPLNRDTVLRYSTAGVAAVYLAKALSGANLNNTSIEGENGGLVDELMGGGLNGLARKYAPTIVSAIAPFIIPAALAALGIGMGVYSMFHGKSVEEITGKKPKDITTTDNVIRNSAEFTAGDSGSGSLYDRSKNALIKGSQWGLIGGAMGSVIPGAGTATGAALGMGFGAITGFIGGDTITSGLIALKDALFGGATAAEAAEVSTNDTIKATNELNGALKQNNTRIETQSDSLDKNIKAHKKFTDELEGSALPTPGVGTGNSSQNSSNTTGYDTTNPQQTQNPSSDTSNGTYINSKILAANKLANKNITDEQILEHMNLKPNGLTTDQFRMLQPEVAKQALALAAEYEKRTGNKLIPSSFGRTAEESAAIKQKYGNKAENVGVFGGHQIGVAFDAGTHNDVNVMQQISKDLKLDLGRYTHYGNGELDEVHWGLNPKSKTSKDMWARLNTEKGQYNNEYVSDMEKNIDTSGKNYAYSLDTDAIKKKISKFKDADYRYNKIMGVWNGIQDVVKEHPEADAQKMFAQTMYESGLLTNRYNKTNVGANNYIGATVAGKNSSLSQYQLPGYIDAGKYHWAKFATPADNMRWLYSLNKNRGLSTNTSMKDYIYDIGSHGYFGSQDPKSYLAGISTWSNLVSKNAIKDKPNPVVASNNVPEKPNLPKIKAEADTTNDDIKAKKIANEVKPVIKAAVPKPEAPSTNKTEAKGTEKSGWEGLLPNSNPANALMIPPLLMTYMFHNKANAGGASDGGLFY